jgi:hypothetical protein
VVSPPGLFTRLKNRLLGIRQDPMTAHVDRMEARLRPHGITDVRKANVGPGGQLLDFVDDQGAGYSSSIQSPVRRDRLSQLPIAPGATKTPVDVTAVHRHFDGPLQGVPAVAPPPAPEVSGEAGPAALARLMKMVKKSALFKAAIDPRTVGRAALNFLESNRPVSEAFRRKHFQQIRPELVPSTDTPERLRMARLIELQQHVMDWQPGAASRLNAARQAAAAQYPITADQVQQMPAMVATYNKARGQLPPGSREIRQVEFTGQGANHASRGEIESTYDWPTLLHEVGHSVGRLPNQPYRQEVLANRAGDRVRAELVRRGVPGVPDADAFRQYTQPQLEHYRLGELRRALFQDPMEGGTGPAAPPPMFRRLSESVNQVRGLPPIEWTPPGAHTSSSVRAMEFQPTPPPGPVGHTGRDALVAGGLMAGGYAAHEAVKESALKPTVELQPHQQGLDDRVREHGPQHMLLYHALGSGKSLSAIAMAERLGEPYSVVAPASLRKNYEGEYRKFTDGKLPLDVKSYTAIAKGDAPAHLGTLIADESQNLVNDESQRSRAFRDLAARAKQVVLLSGTPIVNRPADLAAPLSILSGKEVTPKAFNARYVEKTTRYPSLFHRALGLRGEPGIDVKNRSELAAKLRGHVDYHDPGKPTVPVKHEDVPVEMSELQRRLYRGFLEKLPWHLKWKLKHDVGMTDQELKRFLPFLTGPRQVSLSAYPFLKDKDPQRAFDTSPKLQEAVKRLESHLGSDPKKRALVFSNFIDAGLTPYAHALGQRNIPHGVFHGGLTDAERQKLVADFNSGKLRSALLGPSGMSGLNLKGVTLTQLLDDHWNTVRPTQAVGRGLRYGSHEHLPVELQNMEVQRFRSRLPAGTLDGLLSSIGFDRTHKQHAVDDYLVSLRSKKERDNQQFLDVLKEVGTEGKKEPV